MNSEGEIRRNNAVTALAHRSAHLCGHRGHSSEGHENSAYSLELAAIYGASICEIDVQMTADGQLAAFHDLVMDDNSTGLGPIWSQPSRYVFSQDTLSRIDGRTLGQIEEFGIVLAEAKRSDLSLLIEPKFIDIQPYLLERINDAVQSHGMQDRTIISSFDFRFLRDSKALNATLATCGIVKQKFVNLPEICSSAKLDMVLVDFPYLDEPTFEQLRDDKVFVAYFVPLPIVFEKLGAFGQRHLQRLDVAVRNGLISVLGCDDTRWGRAFLDSVHTAS